MRAAFGEEFDVPDGYLNTASIGIPSVAIGDAVADALVGWRVGAGRASEFDEPVARAREGFADLIGVGVDRVAMGPAVSALIGLVAAAVPDRTRVLVAGGEFTSVTWPFAAQAGRGVEVTEVDLGQVGRRAGEFDLVAVSTVQSADGRLVDLDALRAARASGTKVVLDATQSLGWLDADLSWADAVVAAGYKWLLSPRGSAWMAIRPELAAVPVAAGWYASADRWADVYGLPMTLAPDARALDTSPAWYCHVGAAVALPWLAGLDRAAVHAHCVGLADTFRAGLGMEPAGSAIVSVRREGARERLAAAGVMSAARAGAARLAFHLYNTDDDVARALDALTAR
ncbi:aminotransferase class V-fold PLP-dependent enzyme [Pseudonocardia sp. DSM 110487]|uniref:aminotransferase class V-fold PLP-dependent enzyme n=1 Tax=Pseudonocardia sp. DSM 110487 TaxID=2865833 RepID=UPI001C6A1592|nr:aminotransferase class V-fold PLP-dependent enzyme [Pseudonocardia sp. DSM 110487]QYN33148.1 aminotransferase class V-fold PLP-dependent enzyme [Pseudonocardia sp. DSM 110487]